MSEELSTKELMSSNDCPTDHSESLPALNQKSRPPDLNSVRAISEMPSLDDTLNSVRAVSEIASLRDTLYQSIHNDFIIKDSDNIFDHGIVNALEASAHQQVEEHDVEDQDSSISELSGLSDLSNLNEDWNEHAGPINWIQRQMLSGIDPRLILGELLPTGTVLPPNVNPAVLFRILTGMSDPPARPKLSHINTLDDAVNLLKTCKRVLVLTGAGVSVSCGIPDFRSKNGVYARLSKDYPDLPDPQAMFDILYFRRDPRPFFKFAKEIYPGQFEPSPSHKFIKLLEKQRKLLRNYTQNIDTLEHAAGIQNVITCHGSFATATCTVCGYKVDCSFIKEDIFNQRIPYCPICPPESESRGIMKPDIVFFGEGLSDEFHEKLEEDKNLCDLIIVMGSSLKVRPVAMIPNSIPQTIPQILINREPLKQLTFDIELLGDCDVIIGELCQRLEKEWDIDPAIPRQHLEEVAYHPKSFTFPSRPLLDDKSHLGSSNVTEMNNNLGTSSSSATNDEYSGLPHSDESNSCDYNGVSAIKLDDSEDGSNQEKPTEEAAASKENSPSESEKLENDSFFFRKTDSISKMLPDQSYVHIPPSRYIFQGAEVYDLEDDDCSSSSTDYSSDSDSPTKAPANLNTVETLPQNHYVPLEDMYNQQQVAANDNLDSGSQKECPTT